MSFPVIIIFLVLLLWFVICLPLLRLYYLESKLDKSYDKIYDMMIFGVNMKELLLYLCASLFLTLLSLMLVFIIKI